MLLMFVALNGGPSRADSGLCGLFVLGFVIADCGGC